MKEMLKGNNWGNRVLSRISLTQNNLQEQFKAIILSGNSSHHIHFTKCPATVNSIKCNLAKTSHLHPESFTLKKKSSVCISSKPMTHARITGEARAPSSQGEVFFQTANPKLLN